MAQPVGQLLYEIQTMLDAPLDGAAAPGLDELEHTLTNGYARALALEGERLRLQRRIGAAAADVAAVGELPALSARLVALDDELTRLRAALSRLRDKLTLRRHDAAPASA